MSYMAPHMISINEGKVETETEDESEVENSDWDLPICFDSPRHNERIEAPKQLEHTWRLKEKYKTHCVALVLCLNVGVDPPDIVKTQPCARLECWVDPQSMSPGKALETIGHNLQQQYERWQPRARYKLSLDPTSDDVKKLCSSLRRNAKDERVLFHYNGHGVPKPTSQGEIWVFNRAFTQYIPLSVYDLQTWMGAPSLYVYDCSNAGVVLEQFKIFAIQHEKDYELAQKANAEKQEEGGAAPSPPPSYRNCIQLAACSEGETLPMNPELPADLFTACLTTPVKMAMKWFVMRNQTARVAPPNIAELIDKIPGQVTDRRTMFGELNWIFTAITDTIAWNSLPTDLFQHLFRADLLTASLCRNFLLADRILRSYNCTPVSSPALPSLAAHPMWQAWDQTLDLALAQLPDMLGPQQVPYQHSPFFKEQLTAFQVWLDLGIYRSPGRPPPDQLPMVLQVLLSTLHRVRALDILCKYLALGEWAVRAVLAVGIFPYMVKLLQASANDLRASMVCIWAKIMAVDGSCQADLVNAKGHKYFLQILQDTSVESEYRTMAAFVLAGIVNNYPAGQEAALQGSLISICLEQLNDSNKALRMWLALCLGRLWRDFDAARWSGVRDLAHEKLYHLLDDPHPEVRCAAVFALGTFVQRSGARSEHSDAIDRAVALTLARKAPHEASPLVRAQILEALQWLVLTFESHFVNVSLQEKRNEHRTKNSRERRQSQRIESGQEALEGLPTTTSLQSLPVIGFVSVYMKLWSTLNSLCSDPHQQVSRMANEIVSYINNQTLLMEWNANRDMVDVRYGNSSSLPPSPNTRANTLPHASGRRVRTLMPNTITEDSGISPHPNEQLSTSTSSSNSSSSQRVKKPIVSTEFVEWASSQFAKCSIDLDWQKDQEGRVYQERKWCYSRNKKLRREAKELENATVNRLESRIFHARCQMAPSVILFHPYEQSVAFASKDTFGIWDLKTENTICTGNWRLSGGRITSLEYANAHDFPLLVLASSIGSVGVFRPISGRKEPQLVTAWSGLDIRNFNYPDKKPLSQSGGFHGGALIAWCNKKCTLTVGGPARYIRIWDARTELRLLDISTECEGSVSALARRDNIVWCGLASGGVRSWDDRMPTRILTTHQDHCAPVLLADVARNTLVTACAKGELRFYDVRSHGLLEMVHTGSSLTAVTMHQYADLVACGSPNHCISIYNLKGEALNTIRFHEGFMGSRIGPVSCLAFHPLRCTLAVGTRDSMVSVYGSSPRRIILATEN